MHAIGIFLLLCLLGIAALAIVIAFLAVKERVVSRRELDALRHAHASASETYRTT